MHVVNDVMSHHERACHSLTDVHRTLNCTDLATDDNDVLTGAGGRSGQQLDICGLDHLVRSLNADGDAFQF